MKASQIIPLTENVELGDSFDIELGNMVVHTGVVGLTTDGVILEADEKTMALLGISGALFESVDSPMVIEGSMDEADALLQDIARGQEDIFRVKDDPEGPVERYVADLLKEKFESVAFDNELDSRKDSAQIAELVRIDLADDVLDTPDQDQPVSLNLNKTSRPIHEQGVAEEHNDTFDPKSHQYKTTMKHADRPTVQQRMAAHDIKPGIAGYRDRIDLLKDLERTGKLKKKGVAEGYEDDSKEREENLRYSRSRNPVADAIRKKLNPNQKEQNKEQGVAEGSTDSKYPHGEVKYRIVYRKSGEKVEGVKSFASKADAQQYAAKDPQYSVQAYRVKQGVAEGKPDQLPTRGADYSQYDTDHLRTLLKPGILHRNEAKFKALIRKELRKREQQGVAEGFPHDVDHMPGPTKKYSNTNCTICHGRKYMYKLDGKLFADNRKDAVKVKCPTCKGTGDKQGVKEGYSDISGLLAASKLYRSFIITAELAEGGTKKFRVKAQSERTAVEKFKQHHSMAKIVNVKEEHNETQDLSPGVRETRIRDRIKSLQNLISIYKDKGDKAKVKELTSELDSIMRKSLDEAEYQGRKVPLGKPMQGDVKKSKVYVKGPNGNVVKVNFGDKNMKIKKSNPKRRKSFRARHNCDNPGPRWKARYWSCRAW